MNFPRTFVRLMLAVCVAASCSQSADGQLDPGVLASLEEQSVKVTVDRWQDDAGQILLRATFEPTESGLHLYDVDLPPTGVQGVGRPTRLAVIADPTATPNADLKPMPLLIDAFEEPLSIYPDSAVTLVLKSPLVEADNGSIEISITYMACYTDGGCKFPVEDRRFLITW